MPKPRLVFYKDPEFLRLQTWVLLFAIVLLLLTFWIPVASFAINANHDTITLLAHKIIYPPNYQGPETHSVIFFLIALGVCIVLLFSAMFQYKNRRSQLFVARFAGMGLIIMGVFGFWYVHTLGKLFGPDVEPINGLGTYLRIAALLCVLIAERLIVRDMRRINAMNRFW